MQYLLTQEELDALKEKANPEQRIIKEKLEKFYTSLSKAFKAADEFEPRRNVIYFLDLKKALEQARKDAGLE